MVRQPVRSAGLLVFALILSLATLAEAGVNAFWRELGGSASGTGVSKASPGGRAANDAWVAIDQAGLPVVAYTAPVIGNDPPGLIIVKRWTGSSWQTVSPANGLGQGGNVQIRISPTGAYFVAWLEDDGFGTQVRLLTRAAGATAWLALGGSNTSAGLTAVNGSAVIDFALAVGADGTPFVAFNTGAQTGLFPESEGILQGSIQTYVKKFNKTSSAWVYLGSDPSTGGGASSTRSFFLDGGADYASHEVTGRSALALDASGTPIVAFSYATSFPTPAPASPATIPGNGTTDNADIFAVRWNANTSAWDPLGPAVPAADDAPATLVGRGGPGGISENTTFSYLPVLAFGGGQLWLAWQDNTSIFVSRWNAAVHNWQEVALSATTGVSDPTSNSGDPSIAVDSLGRVIVTWDSEPVGGGARQIFVLRGDTSGFSEMGPDSSTGDGISAAPANAVLPIVAASPIATMGPAAVWLNQLDGGAAPFEAFLRQFSTLAPQTLRVALTGAGTGTVTSTPFGVSCPDECVATFPMSQSVTLAAAAGPGSIVTGFSGCTAATPTTCTVMMSAAHNVSVNFATAHTLVVQKLGNGRGSIASAPTGIACGTDCSEPYADGTSVTLTATFDAVSTTFGGWGGFCASRGLNPTCVVPISANISTVTAEFDLKIFQVSVTVSKPAGALTQGSAIGAVNDDLSIANCGLPGGVCTESRNFGDHVILHALPTPGNRFINWTGTACGGRANATCDFIVTGNNTLTALFRGATAVVVNKLGNGASRGTFTSTGTVAPIACSAGTCTADVFLGQSVMLKPGGTGTHLTGYSGDFCTSSTGVCTFTPAPGGNGSSNTSILATINATFVLNKQHLHVNGLAAPGSSGFSMSGDGHIDCGSFLPHNQCDFDYDFGDTVVLTPVSGPDTYFDGWSQDCVGFGRDVCTLQMIQNHSVFKNFEPGRQLSVMLLPGNSGGKLTGLRPGHTGLAVVDYPRCQNCTFTDEYPTSASAILTPTPDVGSNFHWLAGTNPVSCIGTTGACPFGMSLNRSGVGQFRLNRHSVHIVNQPSGVVTTLTPELPEMPFDFDCGSGNAVCDGTFDFGTQVVVQALANDGFLFNGWGTGAGAACGGSRNATCSLVLRGNTTFTPTYRARTTLAIQRLGLGSGIVVSTPAGINCGATGPTAACTTNFFDAKQVTLKATAGTGSHFDFFTGVCSSANGSSCTFLPAGNNESIGVSFTPNKETLNVGNTSHGTVVGTVASGQVLDCDQGTLLTCSTTQDFGTQITLQAVVDDGFMLTAWAGVTCNGGNTNVTCTFVMQANQTVSVTYRARTTLAIQRLGLGSGTIVSTPPGINCGATGPTAACAANFFDGRQVVLRATAGTGSHFDFYDGCPSVNGSTCTFVPAGTNESIGVSFTLNKVGYVIQPGNGSVLASLNHVLVLECDIAVFPGGCTDAEDFGTAVTLAATPNPGYQFVNYTGGACNNVTNPTCTFTLSGNVTIAAHFRPRTVVTVSRPGTGAGTIVSTPPGINCSSAPTSVCTATFFDGRPITLTATNATGSHFDSFGGICAPPTGATPPASGFNFSCSFDPKGQDALTIAAVFILDNEGLTVVSNPEGDVTSFLTDVTIACGPNAGLLCSALPPFGTKINLGASPLPGFTFAGWGGVPCTTTGPCTFFASGNTTVVTHFNPIPRSTLHIVTSSAGHVDYVKGVTFQSCTSANDAACSDTEYSGTVVAIQAVGNSGSTFVNWTGGVCSGSTNSTCRVTFSTTNMTVTVNWRAATSGELFIDGQGSITSGAAGVSLTCTSDSFCSNDFSVNRGTPVILTANPAANWTLLNFFGDCTNTLPFNQCNLNTSEPFVSAQATFQFHQGFVNTSIIGPGSLLGSVTQIHSLPHTPSFSCPLGNCVNHFDQGATVTLFAAPVENFVRWTGAACTDPTSLSCTFHVTSQNQTITANFQQPANTSPSASLPAAQAGVVAARETLAPPAAAAGVANGPRQASDAARGRWWWLALAPGALMRVSRRRRT